MGPERATVSDNVKLIEQFTAVPLGFGLVLDVRFLPGIDLVAPALVVFERGAGNLPGVGAGSIEKLRVMPDPLSTSAELHHGKVPGKRHRDQFLFFGSQGEADGNGAGHLFPGAGDIGGLVGQAASVGERLPYLEPRALRVEVSKVADLDTRRGEG